MIKSTVNGKWYPTRKVMEEAEAEIANLKLIEEKTMAKKTEPKKSKPKKTEEPEKIEATPESNPDSPEELIAGHEKRMKMVREILSMNAESKDVDSIAGHFRVAPKYVEDVISKTEEQNEAELRANYNIPLEAPITEETSAKSRKNAKKEKAPKEEKVKKTPLWKIIDELLPQNPVSPAEMIALVEAVHPGLYKDTTIKLHLIGLDITNPKSEKNFPSLFKHAFLEHIGEGKETKYQRKQ